MGEVGIYDREGSILRKGDYRRLIGAVGRREGALTGKDGQTEAVGEPNDGLHHITPGTRFYPAEF